MGGSLSHVLQSPGGLININSSHQKVSDMTREQIYELFDVLKANPRVNTQKIEGLLIKIPKNEHILAVYDSSGYNVASIAKYIMAQYKKFRFEVMTILVVVSCLFLIFHCGECNREAQNGSPKRINQNPNPPNHHHHHHGKGHHSHKKNSDSEEEDTTASPPEMVGMRGLAGAGITYFKPSGSIPKCLGHDFRLEKIIQVTKHCERETGEGKNETDSRGRSLCFTACMYKYLGLIGEDLMFTSNIGSVVVDIFPPIAQPQAKRALRSCAKHSILPLSHADNCTSFGPLKGCILRHVHNICIGEYY